MEGPELATEIVEQTGILPRIAHVMDAEAAKSRKEGKPLSYQVGAIEIYCEQVRDLLGDGDNMEVRGAGRNVICVGQEWLQIDSVDQFMEAIKRSQNKRVFKANAVNAKSSRSHHVFQIRIDTFDIKSGRPIQSFLNIVDLAGSERQGQLNNNSFTAEKMRNRSNSPKANASANLNSSTVN